MPPTTDNTIGYCQLIAGRAYYSRCTSDAVKQLLHTDGVSETTFVQQETVERHDRISG